VTYASDVKLSSLNEITERLVGLIRYYILLMIIMPTESHPNYTVCFLKLNSVIGLRQKAKRCANYSYNRINLCAHSALMKIDRVTMDIDTF